MQTPGLMERTRPYRTCPALPMPGSICAARMRIRRRRGAKALMIAGLMASTLTEPTLGVGIGRGCEGAIEDGAGREGVVAVNAVAES
jgi:hypothetical protein